ncbi:MAG: hypothetical protein AB1551_03125 [Actinomycetota bacterium]
MPIPLGMGLDRTLDQIAAAFALAVEDGRFEEAEGWFAVARLASCRDPDVPDRSPAAWLGEEPMRPA